MKLVYGIPIALAMVTLMIGAAVAATSYMPISADNGWTINGGTMSHALSSPDGTFSYDVGFTLNDAANTFQVNIGDGNIVGPEGDIGAGVLVAYLNGNLLVRADDADFNQRAQTIPVTLDPAQEQHMVLTSDGANLHVTLGGVSADVAIGGQYQFASPTTVTMYTTGAPTVNSVTWAAPYPEPTPTPAPTETPRENLVNVDVSQNTANSPVITVSASKPIDGVVASVPVTVSAVYDGYEGFHQVLTSQQVTLNFAADQSTATADATFVVPDDLCVGNIGTLTVTIDDATFSPSHVEKAFSVTSGALPTFTVDAPDHVKENDGIQHAVVVTLTKDTAVDISATIGVVDTFAGLTSFPGAVSTQTLTFGPTQATQTVYFTSTGAADGKITTDRKATFTVTSGTVTASDITLVDDLEEKYSLPIAAGWNLLSFPYAPTNPNQIWGDVALSQNTWSLWQYTNGAGYKYYSPQEGYSHGTLAALDPVYGFWVSAKAATSVDVIYDPAVQTSVPTLVKSNNDRWFLVTCPWGLNGNANPYSLSGNADVVYSYSSAAGKYSYYTTNALYSPGTLSSLNAWHGYWVLAK